MTGPADEIAPGQGRWRASHADREQVVGILKAAFVQGRLTADELDERVGQALAARTYADLAALTTDLPADPAPARRPHNTAASRAVKAGAGAIGAMVIAVIAAGVVVGQPVVFVFIAVFMVVLAAVTTAVVASLIHVALKLESRQQRRPRGQRPPGPESGPDGHSAQHVQAPGADPSRLPRGLLATGLAG